MKFKTTKKAIMNGYCKVLCVGYCDLQCLLSCEEPTAYTCGAYGWNANIYHINNAFAICTGYRPFGNIQSDYEYNKNIEKQAKTICNSWGEYTYDERKEKLNELIAQLVKHYTEDKNHVA